MGTRTEVGTGREREQGRRWRPVDEHRVGTGTGAGTETREVADIARKCTRVVDTMWETGETWVEREKNVENEGLVQ